MQIQLEKINQIAVQAGKKIMEIYQKEDFSSITDFKSDNSPLTLADKESHKIIAAELQRLYPEIPVLSEEGKEMPWEERQAWKTFWLVDPLDGTKEFIKRNGEFTVNIALVVNHEVVAGVVYAPVPDILYFGEKGKGAQKTEKGITQKIQVNKKTSQRVAVGSRSHQSPEEEVVQKKYDVTELISIGSSLKFCLVAEGKADLYYRHGPTMEWDTAAGQAVVEAAGGKVLNGEGQVFSYNKTSLLNGSFLCMGF